MRVLAVLVLFLPLFAQQAPEGPRPQQHPTPKNLKLLQPSEIRTAMAAYTAALGVQCIYCHVRGDFASDDNHHKETARNMIVMTREINAKFPDGKTHVSCYTCHRGAAEPRVAPGEAPAHEHDHEHPAAPAQ